MEIDPNSALDKIMLGEIEKKITIHVISTSHIVTHDVRNENKIRRVSKDGIV